MKKKFKNAKECFLEQGVIGINPEYVKELEEYCKLLEKENKEFKMRVKLIDHEKQIVMSFMKNQTCSYCRGQGYIQDNPASKYSKKIICPKCKGHKKEFKEELIGE